VGRYRRGAKMAEEWIDDFGGHSRANIKVQEGCDMRCTFCAIWKARGPSRSRPPRDVVEQAQRLGSAGYEEIVLAGVHLGHYGRDLEKPTNLDQLLNMLLEVVDPKVRFRLSSIDPSEVDIRLARRLVEEDRLCRYLHLPLQAGSDEVLRRMRRAYGTRYYRQLVEQIASLDPQFGFGADLIVGFPGETEEDFERSYALLEALPIHFYHVFPYSDRPGTSAAAMPDKVPGPVIRARSERLRWLGESKKRNLLRSLEGTVQEGVVEATPDGAGRFEVMLDNYTSVWCAVDPRLEKRRVRVAVESFDGERLVGASLGEKVGLG
ncbi:MAG: MiaB/RimO family radical SAM methylthiotransferase, partial [Gemmatimonadetes bacterium]|nr:MiaB/RimO family radical SAM methylthiotransferase [Gemmatimonadota bacterium]